MSASADRTGRTAHTSDGAGYYQFDPRFEHPVRAKCKQATEQVLGIRDEKARIKVTPPLGWNPGDDGTVFKP